MRMSDKIAELEKAARSENWGYVDDALPNAVKDKAVVDAAGNIWINSSNVNVRDLAASAFEKAKLSVTKFGEVAPLLKSQMHKDSGNYAGFRAACALVAHGYQDGEVVQVLQHFADDKDVANIAKRYLKRIG